MTEVFCGAVGAMMTLALLALGFAAGWKARGTVRVRRVTAEQSKEEQQRLFEEQRAFENMLHYNRDTAYGMDSPWEDFAGGDGR